ILAGPFTRYQMYVPFAQAPALDMVVTLRTSLPPATLTPAVQAAAAQVDRLVPVYDFASAQELADRVLTNFSVGGWLLAGFAVLGLLLASLGLYAIVSGNVTQRTGEIGVRMALGAQARD